MQLNKLQIKAEILTVISKLQANIEAANVDELLITLTSQEDKKAILEVLSKELIKAGEQKAILICFLILKLCEEKSAENAFWEVLKNQGVEDTTKTIILNVLKDLGNKVEYEALGEYFEDPNTVIDADTKRLLHVAIINPEAQIDFLDFLNSVSANDKSILIKSLAEDYTSDELANIINPLVLYEPESEIAKTSIEILGETKSQLALHTLTTALELVKDEDTKTLIKKNLSKLKISGVREDNAIEFYKSVLSTKPYESYASYPDGHGNQAIIFSRERENETIQIVAAVINDTYGVVDCFGFNEISKSEFSRIVDRFYSGDEHVYINPHVAKSLLISAEKNTRMIAGKISYEFICWKTLLADIEQEAVPIELTLKSNLQTKKINENDLTNLYEMDFVQRWFLDTDFSDEFNTLMQSVNEKIKKNEKVDYEIIVKNKSNEIFTEFEKKLLEERILMSAYLKHLAGKNEDAQILYSLVFDENMKEEFRKNILRKSIYEYYVALKFKLKEENKMTNIFTKKNKAKISELSPSQINSAILQIENLWVK